MRSLRFRPAVLLLLLGVWFVLLPMGRATGATAGANGALVYASSDATLGTVQLFLLPPGGSPRAFTSGGASWAPAWSPDGTEIVYTHWDWSTVDANLADIWVQHADGSGKTQLTNDAAWEDDPVWSPDGSRIAFTRGDGAGESISIWTIPSGGGPATLLHQGGFAPAWSPDGGKIAFVSGVSNVFERGATIQMMNADGGGVTQLTPSPGRDYWPDWSPDGRKIAFLSARSGTWEVWQVNPDGSGLAQVTHTGAACSSPCEIPRGDPAWSPDGSKIAYATATTLLTVNGDGGARAELAPLTKIGGNPTGMPAWQPVTDIGVRAAFKRTKQEKTVKLVITIRNATASTASNLVVSTKLQGPRPLSVISSTGRCAHAICTIDALQGRSSVQVTMTLRSKRHGAITARVAIRTATAELSMADNTTVARATV